MAKKATTFGPKTAQKLYALLGAGPGYSQPPLGSSMRGVEDWPCVFRNDSAETVPAYGCMRVTGAAEVDGIYTLLVAKPNGTAGPFVFNNQAEVITGKTGTYQKPGVVRCYYTSGTVTAGDQWGPTTGWNVTATGSQKAVTVFGTVETNALLLGMMVIPDGQLQIKAPSGGIPPRVGLQMFSAVCDVYESNSSGTLSDSGVDITVFNWGTSAACANGLRLGWAEYRSQGGIWRVVSEDCGDDGGQVTAALSLNPADTGESDDFATTTAGSLFVTPRNVVYTPPVGVVPA